MRISGERVFQEKKIKYKILEKIAGFDIYTLFLMLRESHALSKDSFPDLISSKPKVHYMFLHLLILNLHG